MGVRDTGTCHSKSYKRPEMLNPENTNIDTSALLENMNEEQRNQMKYFSREEVSDVLLNIKQTVGDAERRMMACIQGSGDDGNANTVRQLLDSWGQDFRQSARKIELSKSTQDVYQKWFRFANAYLKNGCINSGSTAEPPTLKTLFTLKEGEDDVSEFAYALLADIVIKGRQYNGEKYMLKSFQQMTWVQW